MWCGLGVTVRGVHAKVTQHQNDHAIHSYCESPGVTGAELQWRLCGGWCVPMKDAACRPAQLKLVQELRAATRGYGWAL